MQSAGRSRVGASAGPVRERAGAHVAFFRRRGGDVLVQALTHALRKSARALSGPHPAGRAHGTRAPDATAGERCAGDPFLRGCARRTMQVRHSGSIVPVVSVKRLLPGAEDAFKAHFKSADRQTHLHRRSGGPKTAKAEAPVVWWCLAKHINISARPMHTGRQDALSLLRLSLSLGFRRAEKGNGNSN